MPVEVIGDYESIPRMRTGLLSLDLALGNPNRSLLGAPLRSMYELYGNEHVGKSTLAYYLAGKVQGSGEIRIASLLSLCLTLCASFALNDVVVIYSPYLSFNICNT